MNPETRYTGTAIVLHWLIAALMILNVGLALSVDNLPEGAVRPVIDTHKSIGITVLGLALLRVLWRSAQAAHAALYLLIFALPLSGWLHDSAWKDAATHPLRLFNLIDWPRIGPILRLPAATKESLHKLFGALHTGLAYGLYGLLALHVGGALKHQFIDREAELQRMMLGRGTEP